MAQKRGETKSTAVVGKSSLLGVAEGALIVVPQDRRNRNAVWAPTSNGRVGMLWQLSYEALDEIASLVEVQVGDEEGREEEEKQEKRIKPVQPDGVRGLTCLTCGMRFDDRESQAEHFATELHKRNARRRAEGKASIAIEEDEEEEAEDQEVEDSVDETESEEDDESEFVETSQLKRNIKSGTAEVVLNENECLSLSVAFLGGSGFRGGRERNALNLSSAAQRLRAVAEAKRSEKKYWLAVLAVRSGRFAGCILDASGQAVLHKSFSRYTTRRGQGGAQSAADNNGRTIKSVGSMLRRHGERALAEEVRELITKTWEDALKQCLLICVAAGASTRGLVLGDDGLLDPADIRIQRLPFALTKPTIAQVTEAGRRLSTLYLHSPTPTVSKHTESSGTPSEKERRATTTTTQAAETMEEEQQQNAELKAQALPAYPEPSAMAKSLLEACTEGDELRALSILDAKNDEESIVNAPDFVGRRPLHLAAAAGTPELVTRLLRYGADPTAVDDRQRAPYFLARDKKTRDAFRVARAELGEDAFDWTKSAVPEPLDAAKLAAKKQKEIEKKKRQREKQKLNKQRAQLQADAEKAKAAARAAADLSAAKKNMDTCDQCKKPIPSRRTSTALFYHGDFAFCSSACAAAHRRAQCAAAAERRFQSSGPGIITSS